MEKERQGKGGIEDPDRRLRCKICVVGRSPGFDNIRRWDMDMDMDVQTDTRQGQIEVGPGLLDWGVWEEDQLGV
jgi:hypothetical protein